MASSAGSDDGTSLDKKEARPAWKPVPAATPGKRCAVMGDKEFWPPLPGSRVITSAAAGTSSSTAVADESTESCNSGRNGDRAAPVPERRAAVPSSSSPSSSINGGASFRGRQNNNGRFAPHPQGRRGGEGYNYNNNGNRRPFGDTNNGRGRGRGDVNVHVHINSNGYGNFNAGGSNNNNNVGQRRGERSHPNGHWHGQGHRPSGHQQMAPMEPPHHGYPQLPPPPPFMGMVPAVPYYDPYAVYGPYAYSAEYAVPSYYFPPPALPVHTMPPHWEQQGDPAPQQDAPAPQTAEELLQSIRAQIEYYFSPFNLNTDAYLKAQMDTNGWVPLSVIAEFRRIKNKSTDLDFITTSLLPSEEVEVEDGKVRRRYGWEQYITSD